MTGRSPLPSSSPVDVTTTRRSPIKTEIKITISIEYQKTQNGTRIKDHGGSDLDWSWSYLRDVISMVMKIIHMIDLILKIVEIISDFF